MAARLVYPHNLGQRKGAYIVIRTKVTFIQAECTWFTKKLMSKTSGTFLTLSVPGSGPKLHMPLKVLFICTVLGNYVGKNTSGLLRGSHGGCYSRWLCLGQVWHLQILWFQFWLCCYWSSLRNLYFPLNLISSFLKWKQWTAWRGSILYCALRVKKGRVEGGTKLAKLQNPSSLHQPQWFCFYPFYAVSFSLRSILKKWFSQDSKENLQLLELTTSKIWVTQSYDPS